MVTHYKLKHSQNKSVMKKEKIIQKNTAFDLRARKFKEDFCASGVGQFGSGWVWLVKSSDGSLKILKTENGVNPLCHNETALLGCDVWEHSYYLDYRNKRPAYLENFFDKLINWEYVDSLL